LRKKKSRKWVLLDKFGEKTKLKNWEISYIVCKTADISYNLIFLPVLYFVQGGLAGLFRGPTNLRDYNDNKLG
jgi:hypothetical protein